MTDRIKIKILGKTLTLYSREDTDKIFYQFNHEGTRYRGSTGKTSFTDINELELTKLVVNTMEGRPTKKKVISFSTAYRDFYKYKKEMGSAKRTLNGYTQRSRRLLEYFGKKDIAKIGTALNYEKYRKWKLAYYDKPENQDIYMRRNGKRIKHRRHISSGVHQIDIEINLLRIILNWAKKIGKIPRDVYIDEYEPSTAAHKETLILKKEEYMAITDYMMKDNPLFGMIVRFVNNTGIRYPGELTPLKWKHIDFHKSTISINERKSKGNRVDSLIPMTKRVREILMWLYNRDVPNGDEDYIFIKKSGMRVMNIRGYWKKTLDHLGINHEYTMYGLRHLFAVRMIRRPEINVRMLAELLGHSSIQMVETTYARWISIEHKIDAMNKSEARREEILRSMEG